MEMLVGFIYGLVCGGFIAFVVYKGMSIPDEKDIFETWEEWRDRAAENFTMRLGSLLDEYDFRLGHDVQLYAKDHNEKTILKWEKRGEHGAEISP